MKKTTIYLPDETFTWLEQETKRTELKMAEIIRRALDEYMEKRRTNPCRFTKNSTT